MEYNELISNFDYKNIIKRKASEDGNFLEIRYITPISLCAIMLYGKKKEIHINRSDFKYLEAIDINEDLLIFSGYQKHGNIYSYEGRESFYILNKDDLWYLSDIMNNMRQIKYIHEVQKIHKAFFGKEMFIKK